MNTKICLTCLGKPCKFYNLEEVVLENLKIRDLIHELVPLVLEEYDFSIPDNICEKCMKDLIISFNFQKKCLDSLKNLRTMWTENSLNNKTFKGDTTDYFSNDDNTISSQPEEDFKIILNSTSTDPLIMKSDDNIVIKSKKDEDNHNGKTKQLLKDKKVPSNQNSESHQINEKSSTASNQCNICSRHFKQPQGLASHISKTHLKKHLYQCQKCSKGFDAEEPFIRHCNRHLGIKPFPCSNCEKSFETIGHLNKHMFCHSKEVSYTCKICKTKFDTLDDFKQHTHHNDEQKCHCLKCDKTFESLSEYTKHLEGHKIKNYPQHEIKKPTIAAPTSHEQFNKLFYSIRSTKLQNKEDTNDHQKHTCYKYTDKNEFEKIPTNKTEMLKQPLENIPIQVKSLANDDEEVLLEDKEDIDAKTISSDIRDQLNNSVAQNESAQCNICKQIFKNSQGLAIHKSSTHLKIYVYQCDLCDRGFNVEEFYIKHRNHHLGIKTFKCNQCDKVFETNSILNQHLISHSKSTPHLCTTCGKGFRRIDSLRQHIRRHGDERPFKCSVCPKDFKCLSNKIKHMVRHTEKRYECNICGTCLGTSVSLSQHKMIHSGEKPKKCQYCDKRFITMSNLKCHERTHTGEKPYKCEYCWKSFCQSGDRKKHTKRMHKDELKDTKSEKV